MSLFFLLVRGRTFFQCVLLFRVVVVVVGVGASVVCFVCRRGGRALKCVEEGGVKENEVRFALLCVRVVCVVVVFRERRVFSFFFFLLFCFVLCVRVGFFLPPNRDERKVQGRPD